MKRNIEYVSVSPTHLRKQMILGTLMLALAVIIFAAVAGHAQSTTSAVNGTVTDTTGAVVAGASISVVNTATGITYHAGSDNVGAYHVTQLPPGTYTMEVTKSGFETQHLQPFQLFVDQQIQENIALGVGGTTQTVSVSAGALLLDTQASNQGQIIENQQIQDMPLNGRDVLQLAQLSAGVTPIISGMSSPASQWTGTQTVALAIAGLREDDASYLYDGIETRNAWYGAAGLLPSPDFTQEFKVEQSGSSAAYGNGAAFINVVTKSGTNQFHGNAYEYIRNNDFDARNYFDAGAAPPFHQNQFGASLGGPIRKNKMFFFGNYEGFRQIFPADNYVNVPNAQQLAGNFSGYAGQLYNPYISDPNTPTGYAIFPGNQIPGTYFNPVAQKVLALYPAANGSYPGGQNYFYVANTTDNWNQENVRFDYAISGKDSVFARFTNQNQTTNVTDITPSREIIYPSDPKNLGIGWTHVFSPNLINNVRYGWAHTAVGEQRADGYDASKANPLGLINEVDQPGSYGPPSIGVTNYANPGSTEGTDIVREGLNMWTEALSWQKGRHQITAGLDIRYQPIFMYEDWAATSISFNGSYSGDPVADLLLGIPTSSSTAIGDPTLNLRMWYQSYYIQDNIQVSRHLSINVGGRWEHGQPPVDTRNHVGSFDVATNQDLSYPDTSTLGLGRNMVKPIYTNFAPRFGFNWTPLSNTDVKGGFGLYYLQPNINQYEVEVDTTKFYLIQGYNNSPVGQPLNFNLSQLFASNVQGGGPTASFIQPNGKTPYTYEWNLSIDHTLKNWLFGVSYLGSAAHHYEERPNIDPENPDGTFPFPGWNGVQENTNSGSSIYNGLIIRAEHRYSSGFSVLGSYTFSKCLGWPWQDVFSWHPLDMRLDRGHCQLDLTRNLVANAIYELPFGHGKAFLNKGALMDAVVGGWKLAAIASLHSGPWLTLGSNQSLGIFVNALPNVTGPVNNSSLNGDLGKHGKLGPYFNIQNVQPVTGVGVQGNSSVQSVYGPGSADWDLSGDKTWKFVDRYGLTFRADVFNAFNRVNFNGLDTGVNDTRFGYVQGAGPAREIQLSLRFAF
ncbi:TonB-dependent receptor [Acidicapsa ligni]|uniref:TonB-dependent receptor n=1 Tax=Acidicapsa ligni TaxID=542300 RepID=UPI0021E0F4D6|nr:carboxypeptidase regulatory-like domain-containing protein [Acidicapsa ligni]